ncbi:hypothetical protein [Pseudodesulfovibrio sp. zrk46]|uniref:hypothetical protein n=1 Tax=Pseudodesulfovibrio sp. zrk46 TaxID=2725288 RepID=UPI00144998DC|nr:hypothetical protein [Pseudodesulfovibrio sp. zrk46]QJB55135.1 hypothetical protein HFN16_01385 [Pseudodesulfovibrio sp. zrk46]
MNKTEPYFDEDGTLVIPFECADHSFKYWKQEGKKMSEVLTALGVDEETWAKYTHEKFPDPSEAAAEEESASE